MISDDVWGAVRHFFTAEHKRGARTIGERAMTSDWRSYVPRIEDLARTLGLDCSTRSIFEAVPDSFMMEIAVYGLPVRMPHWSFGVRYIYQLIQRHMGHSRLFEVVFPGNPGHAYLAASNGLAENVLVTAHVLGHADFSRNNLLFRRCQEQVQRAASSSTRRATRARSSEAIESHGRSASRRRSTRRSRSSSTSTSTSRCAASATPSTPRSPRRCVDDAFRTRFATLDAATRSPGAADAQAARPAAAASGARPACGSSRTTRPEMESWERDIFLAVREESFYFYPVFATQIMNEGWASYWHARLLREADFVPQETYVDAIKCHSDVVRPIADRGAGGARDQSLSPGIHAVGEDHREAQGLEAARRIMREDDDFSFVRNHLTRDIAEELGLFRYNARSDGQIKVVDSDIDELHEAC